MSELGDKWMAQQTREAALKACHKTTPIEDILALLTADQTQGLRDLAAQAMALGKDETITRMHQIVYPHTGSITINDYIVAGRALTALRGVA